MADTKFQKGNRFWEARSTHGRKPIFGSPEELEKCCLEYFQWCEDNPLMETKAFAFQGEVTMAELPKMRAMTIMGLCMFLDIAQITWREYKKRDDFTTVTTRIEDGIRNQKFMGASADLLNANIIARDLGLADKREINGELEVPKMTISIEEVDARKPDGESESE